MLRIVQVETDEERLHARHLLLEYLTWVNGEMAATFGSVSDVRAMVDNEVSHFDMYSPPRGRMLLAYQDGSPAGCAALRDLGEGIGEVKRLYVRPTTRGSGVGRLLLASIIQEAQFVEYTALRLDSTPFMKQAHSLYRSFGFVPIEAYPQSAVPEEWRASWTFMELQLHTLQRDDAGCDSAI